MCHFYKLLFAACECGQFSVHPAAKLHCCDAAEGLFFVRAVSSEQEIKPVLDLLNEIKGHFGLVEKGRGNK